MMKNKKLLGNLLLILTAMIWGMAFAFQRKGMESIEPLTFTAVRMVLAAVVVGMTALISRSREKRSPSSLTPEEEKIRSKNTVLGGICCGIFLAAASLSQQIGMVSTSAGKAGFITAMYILLVPIVNSILFKKKNHWLVWLAVLISIVGMYLLCMTEGFRLAHGDMLICLCAVMFCGQILCCDYFVRFGDPIQISAIQILTCAVISVIVAFLTKKSSLEQIHSAVIPILYCGIMSCGVGYTLQMVAQKFTDPTIASLLMSFEAVFAVIGGAVLLNERMTFRELLGCFIMFAAIILVQLPAPDEKSKRQN